VRDGENCSTAKRSSGRPRSVEADAAILEATMRLLAEQGYARMSIEAVAESAGVGKTTIYRRYPGKRELVVAAIEHFLPLDDLATQDGPAREAILALYRRTLAVLTSVHGTRLIGTLLAEEGTNPELLAFFRERVISPRIAALRGVLERGIARGEVRSDTDLDAAIHMLFGSFLAGRLSGSGAGDDWPDRIVATLWRAIGLAGDRRRMEPPSETGGE
jgi:AcrR family transcriptional regulator